MAPHSGASGRRSQWSWPRLVITSGSFPPTLKERRVAGQDANEAQWGQEESVQESTWRVVLSCAVVGDAVSGGRDGRWCGLFHPPLSLSICAGSQEEPGGGGGGGGAAEEGADRSGRSEAGAFLRRAPRPSRRDGSELAPWRFLRRLEEEEKAPKSSSSCWSVSGCRLRSTRHLVYSGPHSARC